jgi:hypothetical protein
MPQQREARTGRWSVAASGSNRTSIETPVLYTWSITDVLEALAGGGVVTRIAEDEATGGADVPVAGGDDAPVAEEEARGVAAHNADHTDQSAEGGAAAGGVFAAS